VYIVEVVLLAVLAVHVFLNRRRSQPPKWMGRLQAATPRFALTLGVLLMGVFPGDLLTSITVGAHLANNDVPGWHGLVFVAATLLLLALPALLVLFLGNRAKATLPEVRSWMTTNSWIVSEIVIVFFVVIVVDSLVR
jgi:hypothetical protein